MNKTISLLPSLLVLGLLVGCGAEDPPAKTEAVATVPLAWTMSADPGLAYSVGDAKEELPEEEIIVVGRVHRMVNGFASLTLMDDKMNFCGEVNKADSCKTPWDYCCDTPEDRLTNALNVQFAGADGKVAKVDLGGDLRECDLVVVRGKVTKDEHGNVTVHAREFFRRERPDLPDYVIFPE